MIRNLKTLSVVVAAVFALTAIGASAASAGTFTAGSATGNLTGVQTTGHVFTTSAGTVTCSTVHFTGTWTSAEAASQTMTPKYEGCKAFGFIGVPIHTNGCSFRITPNEVIHTYWCPVGKSLEITTPGCTTSIGGPQSLSSSTYTNTTNATTGKMDILIHTDVTNAITYNECGTVRSNGSYTGTTTVTGADTSGNPVDLTIDTP